MNADPLEIPLFLKRDKEHTVTQPADKTPRTKTELPTQLSDGTVLADQTIEQLIALRDDHQKLLADVPRIELELRSIRHMIRRKA
jgi:hypothetical protein